LGWSLSDILYELVVRWQCRGERLLEVTKGSNIDNTLLEKFQQEMWSKIPHLEEKQGEAKVVNATPLIDITEDLKECAKNVYNLNLADSDLKVYGKFDSNLLTGSIKVRPAVHIIHDAIVTGKLRSGQTIIEATSGNFGIALGLLSKLGLSVVALVSRKLQEGVFEELRNENIRIMDLDMDICPAPGMKDNPNLLAAKATAVNIRSQLSELGFDPAMSVVILIFLLEYPTLSIQDQNIYTVFVNCFN